MAKQQFDLQSSCQHSIDEIGKQDEKLVNNSVFLPRASHASEMAVQGAKPSLKQLLKSKQLQTRAFTLRSYTDQSKDVLSVN